MRRIAVIGGGAAGLMAAWRLAGAGVEVVLYERSGHLGGRGRSEVLDGCTVDTGAQLFASGFTTVRRVAREIGADSLLVRSPGRDSVYRAGRSHPIVYGSVSSMVKSSALPTRLKLKLGARYVPFLMHHARQLDASDPVPAGGDVLDRGSVAEWGRETLGQEFVELLAYPLLGAYYGTAPEDMSVAMYHALAKAGLDVSVYGVRGGIGAFFEKLADAAQAHGAEIRRTSPVRGLTTTEAGVAVEQNDETTQFDAAVIAVPAPLLPDLIALPPQVEEWLARVRFVPSAVLALVLDQAVAVDYFGLSLLRTEFDDLVAICVQARKLDGLVPPERGLLICLGSPQANAELTADAEAAVERMVAAAERVFPGLRQRIIRAKLYRHEHGYPVFFPGYLKHLRGFPADALPRGVQLAGDYLVAPTVEGALRSGERAAQALLRHARARA